MSCGDKPARTPCVVRRWREYKGTAKPFYSFMGGAGKWPENIANARVFANEGAAKQAIARVLKRKKHLDQIYASQPKSHPDPWVASDEYAILPVKLVTTSGSYAWPEAKP